MALLCKQFIISGKVQGVWYRATTKTKAQELGLSGFAKNLPDGRVEVIACGEEESIKALEQFLYQGPPLANVSHIEIKALPYQEYADFTTK